MLPPTTPPASHRPPSAALAYHLQTILHVGLLTLACLMALSGGAALRHRSMSSPPPTDPMVAARLTAGGLGLFAQSALFIDGKPLPFQSWATPTVRRGAALGLALTLPNGLARVEHLPPFGPPREIARLATAPQTPVLWPLSVNAKEPGNHRLVIRFAGQDGMQQNLALAFTVL